MTRIQFGACSLLCLLGFTANVSGQIKILGGGLGGSVSRSVSVTNENGLKTTRVTENGKKFVIRQGEDLIEVEFVNSYGPNDMDKLKEKHPDLHMHVTSFPKKTGDSAVELTVSVKEKVSAENESELKDKSETAFGIFEKYTRNNAAGGPFGRIELDLRGGGFGKPERLIEFEKEAQKRVEELRKKAREMREKIQGGELGTELKPEAAGEQKKTGKKKSEKKDLIKT